MKHGLTVTLAALCLPALAACTDNSTAGAGAAGDDRTITVTATSDACELSTETAPAGTLVYEVTNQGDEVTEFYLYGDDGLRIVGEIESIGPGLSRDLVVNVPAGTYRPTCKPGMTGTGIRGSFTAEDTGEQQEVADGATDTLVATANRQYQAYVADQTAQLLSGTREFVTAYKAGRDDRARALYAPTRVHWERIEPVAESFGDLDPRMDLREGDLEPGQEWTGWHRIEKDLWPPSSATTALTRTQRADYADRLLADTRTLSSRVQKLTFTVDQVANGSKSLLDEVATGKVTGEEEIFSHTDLYDFQANVDGARVAFEGLVPVLEVKDPDLRVQISRRFAELQALLDEQRVGSDGFVSYTELTRDEVRTLSDAVNALSEPLSKLTAAVTL